MGTLRAGSLDGPWTYASATYGGCSALSDGSPRPPKRRNRLTITPAIHRGYHFLAPRLTLSVPPMGTPPPMSRCCSQVARQGLFMSGESLLVILLVGLIAGWLAGLIVRGTGFGLIADIALGIVGALIGAWLLPRLGIHLGRGLVPAIIGATIGALLLLLILGLVYRRGRWR